MDYPWFFAIAMVPIIGAGLYLMGRRMKRVKDKVDRGDAKWTDEWDPFQ